MKITMNSFLTAVLDLANQDLIEERVENNIPEMNCEKIHERCVSFNTHLNSTSAH